MSVVTARLVGAECGIVEITSPKHRKDEVNALRKVRNAELKQEIFLQYGGRCECCGETQLVFLAIDHVYGDGSEERKKYGMVPVFIRILKG